VFFSLRYLYKIYSTNQSSCFLECVLVFETGIFADHLDKAAHERTTPPASLPDFKKKKGGGGGQDPNTHHEHLPEKEDFK